MKRYGMVIGLLADKIEAYKRLHAPVWPDVLRMIQQCNIQQYSIYLRQFDDGQRYLFSYFEYTGSDFAGDMAKMAADAPNAGGPFASPAKSRWVVARRTNGGPPWKRALARASVASSASS
jgi:L-rhamnose mutarotase